MQDSTLPPPEDRPQPFGAGLPAEPLEPVRLSPGEVRGHAIPVHGQVQPVEPHAAARAEVEGSASSPPGSDRPRKREPAAAAPAAGAPPPGSQPWGPQPSGPQPSGPQPSGPQPPGAHSPRPPPGTAGASPSARPPGRPWIALAHLLFLIPFPPGILITAGLWIWRRARDPLMADQGREAINMQLTFWLAMGLLGATCVSTPLVPFVYVLGAVLCVLAAIAAWSGDQHRYPWVFRFLT